MKHCTSCQRLFLDDANFCIYDGKPLADSSPSAEGSEEMPTVSVKITRMKSSDLVEPMPTVLNQPCAPVKNLPYAKMSGIFYCDIKESHFHSFGNNKISIIGGSLYIHEDSAGRLLKTELTEDAECHAAIGNCIVGVAKECPHVPSSVKEQTSQFIGDPLWLAGGSMEEKPVARCVVWGCRNLATHAAPEDFNEPKACESCAFRFWPQYIPVVKSQRTETYNRVPSGMDHGETVKEIEALRRSNFYVFTDGDGSWPVMETVDGRASSLKVIVENLPPDVVSGDIYHYQESRSKPEPRGLDHRITMRCPDCGNTEARHPDCVRCGAKIGEHSKVMPLGCDGIMQPFETWTCTNHAPGNEVKDIPVGENCGACGRAQS